MTRREKREHLRRCILRLAGQALPSEPSASVVLLMLASAIELGTQDELADAVIGHETQMLIRFREDMEDCIRDMSALKIWTLRT